MLKKASSNTGAQTPSEAVKKTQSKASQQTQGVNQMPKGILGFVDYLSCTFPGRTNSDLHDLQNCLGGEWAMTPRGTYGYKKGLKCGGMNLWYDGRPDMGINLQVSGAGCRELEVLTIKQGWPVFLGDLLDRGAKFSRLDVAIDDYIGLLSMEQIEGCCRAGLVVGRFKTIEPKGVITTATGDLAKTGFVFGKRTSETLVRIYDKALQQGEDQHHIRVELEAHGARAKKLAQTLADNGDGVIAGIIASAIDFKVKGQDSHRNRWPSQVWWRRFLGKAEKIRLSTAPAMPTLDRAVQALERQFGPTLASIIKIYGPEKLEPVMNFGRPAGVFNVCVLTSLSANLKESLTLPMFVMTNGRSSPLT